MWVIIDDLVINIGEYKGYHPGGSFALEHFIGQDISKYFYGGYKTENFNSSRTYTHSNQARLVV